MSRIGCNPMYADLPPAGMLGSLIMEFELFHNPLNNRQADAKTVTVMIIT